MEIYKRKENYADPVRTAKKNFAALGILFLIASFLIYTSREVAGISLVVMAVLMIVIAILLGKKKILGVYLGWVYVLVASVLSVLNGALLGLLIVAYIGYWNYKAYLVLKNPTTTSAVA